MSKVNTILLCLLALGVVIFLAIYEPLTSSTREQANAARDGRVLHLNPAGVREIHLSSPEGDLEIKRKGNGWQIGPKPKDRGDAEMIRKLLETASQIKFFDRIDASEVKDGDKLSPYGLRSPKRKIEFRGDDNVTLFIGKDAANEDRLYVRSSGSRDVFLVGDDILDVAFPKNTKFRDRRLTNLLPEQIDRVIIRKPGGEIELQQDARGWRMVRPLNAPADDKTARDFLNLLLALAIQDFVGNDSGDLGAYGITEGNREISFYAEGGDRAQTLRFGSERDGGVLAQFTARDTVYRLPKAALALLQVTPDDFRDRRLLPINLDLVDLIRIHTDAADFALRRADDKWVLVQGEQRRPASSAAVQALADAVSTAAVMSYVPAVNDKLVANGFVPPRARIDFLSVLSENTPEAASGERLIATLSLGKTENGQLYTRVGETPELGVVPDSLLHAIPLDPNAWVSPR